MTDNILQKFEQIVGRRHVLTNKTAISPYINGYRVGGGQAIGVVRPGSLAQLWQVLKICVAHDLIIIMQAANTGLTGGSTPDAGGYDRDVVLINTLRMNTIYPVENGAQVVCLPGATLYQLEKLLKPMGRDPHSVIGSSCIGASVIGGVCNNSGGTLIQRGPAYTELSLYARIDENGDLTLVNNLDIDLGLTAEEILKNLDAGKFEVKSTDKKASDCEYHDHVRQIDADTPARFNADARRLYQASGSAGRIIVFAVRLDSFQKQGSTKMYYIGTNDTSVLTKIRRDILGGFENLPVSGEYMHAEAYDIAQKYGRDIFKIIYYFGTEYLPDLFKAKGWVDSIFSKIGINHASDYVMQFFSNLMSDHLPDRLKDFRQKYEHYLMINMAGDAAQNEIKDYLSQLQNAGWFECSEEEAKCAGLHRFAAAGAGIRYQNIHNDKVQDMIALDIALRRNDHAWFEDLPDEIERAIDKRLYYGHFFCHVFHQDYLIKKGFNTEDIKNRMLEYHDSRGAEYPAEHNVGHVYFAKPELKEFYKKLDPTNSFNPGIGKTSKLKNWQSD